MLLIELSAEREGFEPPVPLGTTVFKTVVIDKNKNTHYNKAIHKKRVQRYN